MSTSGHFSPFGNLSQFYLLTVAILDFGGHLCVFVCVCVCVCGGGLIAIIEKNEIAFFRIYNYIIFLMQIIHKIKPANFPHFVGYLRFGAHLNCPRVPSWHSSDFKPEGPHLLK